MRSVSFIVLAPVLFLSLMCVSACSNSNASTNVGATQSGEQKDQDAPAVQALIEEGRKTFRFEPLETSSCGETRSSSILR